MPVFSLRVFRGLSLLALIGFVSSLGGRLIEEGTAQYMIAGLLFSGSALFMGIGYKFQERIDTFIQRNRSSKGSWVIWAFYGLQFAFLIMFALNTTPEPTPLFLLEFSIFLLFCLTLYDPKGAWALMLHTGVMVFLSLLYVDTAREWVVMIFLFLVVYAGTMNHYVDRLAQAGYKKSVSGGEAFLLASVMNGILFASGAGYMRLFPNRTEPVVFRQSDGSRRKTENKLDQRKKDGGEETRQREDALRIPVWLKLLLMALSLGGSLLVGYLILRRAFGQLYRFWEKGGEGEEEKETGQGQAVELKPISPGARTFAWQPVEGGIREKMIRAFAWFQRMMARRGYERRKDETPRAFLERVKKDRITEAEELDEIADTFENARYNRIPFSKEILERFRDRLNSVLDDLRSVS